MTPRRRYRVLIPMALVSLLVNIDGSAATLALPMMQRQLTLNATSLQWTTIAFLVGGAAVAIPAGALGDRLGQRRFYLVGLALLGAGSVITALSPSFGVLVAGRTIAGCGGAVVTVLALALVASAVPETQLTRIVGLWAAASSAAATIGPMVTGGFIEALGWRWFFAINVVPLAATAYLVRRYLAETPRTENTRIPVGSIGLLTAAVLCVTAGFSALGQSERHPPASWALLAAGFVLFVVFVRHERRTPNPIADWRHIALRPLPAVFALLALLGFALTGSMYQQTVALQEIFSYSPLLAGVIDVGAGVLYIVAAGLTAWFARTLGVARSVALGMLLLAVAIGGTAAVDQRPGVVQLFLLTSLIGLGIGIAGPMLNATAMAGVDTDTRGSVSGILSLSSQFASVVGIVILGSLTSAVTRGTWVNNIERNLASDDPSTDAVGGDISEVFDNLGVNLSDQANAAYAVGVTSALVAATVMVLIGAVLALIGLRKVRPVEAD